MVQRFWFRLRSSQVKYTPYYSGIYPSSLMFQFLAIPLALVSPFFILVKQAALVVTVLTGIVIILVVRARKGVEEDSHPKLALVRKVVYFGTAGALIVSGYTGLSSDVMHGWALWWHMAMAPMVIIGILMVGLLGAERARLKWDVTFPGNLTFWLTLSLAIVAVSAILLCMLPVFGSSDQATLYTIHKYAALFVLCTFTLHLCGCTGGRKGNTEEGIANTDLSEAAADESISQE
jgi:hypothetical protein